MIHCIHQMGKHFICSTILLALLVPIQCRRQLEDYEDVDEESSFACPDKFGYFADSANCSKYHICDHGKATLKTCDDGLVFSTILKTCDWPYNVHCNIADGNRGDFSSKHLRLRPSEEVSGGNQIDNNKLNKNRQTVFTNEDDSYWLGRPQTSLLAGWDDDYVDNYHEARRVSKAKSGDESNERSKPESDSDDENEDVNDSPWYHNVNYDKIRKQTKKQEDDIQSTTARLAATTPAPIVNSNQRANGWRPRARQPVSTRANTLAELLPRRALRIGSADDDVLVDENEPTKPTSDYENEDNTNSVSKLRQSNFENYRLVTRVPSTTVPPSVQPQHIGTSFRRRVIRKQIVKVSSTTTTPTQPPTTSRPLRNSWRTSQVEPLFQRNNIIRNNSYIRSTQPSPQVERTFERKPVLRPVEENDESEGNSNDDDIADSFYFSAPYDIRKKSFKPRDDLQDPVVAREVPNNLQQTPNPMHGRRVATTTTTSAPPQTPTRTPSRLDNESIFKAFNRGFHQAVRPTASFANQAERGNNPAIDMEYEDVGNEDEDENVEEAEEEGDEREQPPQDHKSNKEIVVRYDDEEEESDQGHRNLGAQTNNSTGRTVSNRQWLSTTLNPTAVHTVTPSPPRLTQFVDILVNNKPAANLKPRVQSSTNTGVHLVDHNYNPVPNNVINSRSRSFVNFGYIPTLENTSIAFLPPPLLSNQPTIPPNLLSLRNYPLFAISPKQPRSAFITPKPAMKKNQPKNFKPQKKPKNWKSHPKERKVAKIIPNLRQRNSYEKARACMPEVCKLPNCRCGGLDIPGGFSSKDTPQLVLLTFDDSVNDLNREIYRKLFEEGRKNPNGCPIRSTFYVSHEWTDYSQVQNLYAKGHEIASHSISHSFGEKFSKERWLAEVAGQREILSLYGGVDPNDVRGMRAPFLQTGGNTMFEMLKEANFTYDSSMPVYDIEPPLWPYTLDYSINHDCMIEPCPTSSIPGLWEVGMVMWEDLRGGRCSMADGCFNPSNEDGVYEMVKANFLRHYRTNRAPFGMYFHSRWFLTEHNMKGFLRFFDEMLQSSDVYVVTNWQMIQWMKQPTSLSRIKNFAPFGCKDLQSKPSLCKSPHTCKVRFRSETRTFRTCQTCPRTYPWTGNNGFN